jgi:hypothetical protein
MQIQNNYSTNYKQNPNFGAVPIQDLRIGKPYLINNFHPDSLLRGTKRVFISLERLVNGILRADFTNLSTNRGGTFFVNVSTGAVKELDEII